MKYNLSIEIDMIISAFKEALGCAFRFLVSNGPIMLLIVICALALLEYFILANIFGSVGWILTVLRPILIIYPILVLIYTYVVWSDQKNKTYSIDDH